MTVSAVPTLSAESVDAMQAASQPLCVLTGGYQERFDASYPRMSYSEYVGEWDGADALLGGTQCDALLTSRNNYDTFRTRADYCTFRVASTLYVATGGWMANRQSACVQYALEWALYELQANGTIDQLYRNYMPITACATAAAVDVATLESTGTSTRRRSLAAEAPAAPHAQATRARGGARGRRLASRSSSPGGSTDTLSQVQMDLLDFVGSASPRAELNATHVWGGGG